MKLIRFFCAAAIPALALVSCNGYGSSGAEVVKEPTVDQMRDMEKGWGMKPHTPSVQRFSPPADAGATASGGAPNPPAAGPNGIPSQQQIDNLPIIPASAPPAPVVPPSLR